MFSLPTIAASLRRGGFGPTSPIIVVGSKIVPTGGATAFDFTGLTGGDVPDTEPSVGDYILLMGSRASTGASGGTLTVVPVGFNGTSTANAQASDTIDTNARLWDGFYEAGSASGGTYSVSGNAGPTGHMTILVLRGVTGSTPLDVTPVTTQRTNGCDILMPDITPITAGALIVAFASSGSESGSAVYDDPPELSNIIKAGRNSTYDNSVLVGLKRDWTAGAFTQARYVFPGGNSLSSAAGMMIAVRPSSYGYFASSTAVTPGTGTGTRTALMDYPVGIQADDIAVVSIVVVQGGSPVTLTVPTGWTEHAHNGIGGVYNRYFLWRRLDGTETGDLAIDVAVGAGTSSVRFGAMSVWRGCTLADPPFESFVNSEQSGASANAASVTTTRPNQIVANFIGVGEGLPTSVPPDGYTEIYDFQTASGYDSAASANYKIYPTAGATGVQTTVLSAGDRNGVYSLAFIPL